MTFLQKSLIYTPPLVRLLAKDAGKALTGGRISSRSHIDQATVEAITNTQRWDYVRFGDMINFTRACNMDFDEWTQMHRASEYLKFCARPKTMAFEYLRRDPAWLTYYRPLMDRWRSSYGIVTKQSDIWSPLRALLMRIPLIK